MDLRNTTLEQFTAALEGHYVIGEQTAPWSDSSAATVAQLGPHVAVTSPPMKMPRGLGTSLGVQAARANVWDSVSTYGLAVAGPDADWHLYCEGSEEEAELSERGARLPEESSGWPLDEAYVQKVVQGRFGIDPGRIPLPARAGSRSCPPEAAWAEALRLRLDPQGPHLGPVPSECPTATWRTGCSCRDWAPC